MRLRRAYAAAGAGKAGTSASVRLRRAYAAAGERDLGAGDRAQAEVLRRIRELERPVDAVVVGQSEGVIPELDRPGRELFRE